MTKLTVQTGETWEDRKGLPVPANRINKFEKDAERAAVKIAKKAIKVWEAMQDLHRTCEESIKTNHNLSYSERHMEVPEEILNYTMANFNQNIKVVREVQKTEGYSKESLEKAYELIMSYLEATEQTNLSDFIKNIIRSRSGQLDSIKANKIVDVVKDFNDETKVESLTKAAEILINDKKEQNVKVYYKIFIKDKKGDYRQVPLNFSSL